MLWIEHKDRREKLSVYRHRDELWVEVYEWGAQGEYTDDAAILLGRDEVVRLRNYLNQELEDWDE